MGGSGSVSSTRRKKLSISAVGIFRRKPVNPDYRDSLAILKRRLASGEITLEEYEAVKKVL